MISARIDYPGHHLHGKTCEVGGSGDCFGIPVVYLRHDGLVTGLPAEKVAILRRKTAKPEATTLFDLMTEGGAP